MSELHKLTPEQRQKAIEAIEQMASIMSIERVTDMVERALMPAFEVTAANMRLLALQLEKAFRPPHYHHARRRWYRDLKRIRNK